MAAGLPVVCFDTGNNRSLLGDSGYYAEPGSDESLTVAVIQALADQETARRKGDAGRERVRQRFSMDHCRAFLLEHYGQLSGKRRNR
jgi:glycosyltransferase involved in cell wall biosynthesis